MKPKMIALTLLGAVALASCARDDTSAGATASAPTADAMPALLGPHAGAAGILHVTDATCHQLLAAPDHDRATATIFYYGYFAARSGTADIDTSKVEGNLRRVTDQCSHNPNMTVTEAFRRTLTTGPLWFWQTP